MITLCTQNISAMTTVRVIIKVLIVFIEVENERSTDEPEQIGGLRKRNFDEHLVGCTVHSFVSVLTFT